ncbi:Phosphopantetheine attachment site [Thalassolituus maritimus]|uniref:Phosphopantetheine attachment site n=1 Tax=Thalassolituus maritimus TaxID=484498 RepID=A0A1N7Q914_9GAMM|nr:condensation domain-containing protein [Thalassolituus maritimus]SIT19352.1 Phosphopantetheine attachment site [Thalassolituus maritimus]
MKASEMGITEKLSSYCQDILEFEVDTDISLVSQGVTSMKLMQLVGKIYEEFNVIVDITDLMEDVSVRTLATLLCSETSTDHDIEQQSAIETPLNEIQRTFWDMQEYSECKKAYNEGVSHLVCGDLDLDLCKQVLIRLVERQPELRTAYYVSEAKPVQRVLEMADVQDKLNIEFADFSGESEPMQAVEQAHRALYATEFDLSQPPNFRVAMWRVGPKKWVVSWVVFHIVTDWWAVDILRKEAALIYSALIKQDGREAKLSTVTPINYNIDCYGERERDEAFWQSRFEAAPAEVDLSTSRRPPIKSYKGDVHLFELTQISYADLNHVRETLSVTMSSFVFSAFNILTSAMSDETDITTGVPFLNRYQPEVQNAVGIFVNSLPIRIGVDKNSHVNDFVLSCHKELLLAYKHGRYPARSILSFQNIKTKLSRSPLYEQLFTYYDNTIVESEYAEFGITVKEIEIPRGTCKYDIAFFVTKQGNALHTKIEYTKALFSEDDITNMVNAYQEILVRIRESQAQPVGDLISDIRAQYFLNNVDEIEHSQSPALSVAE